MFNINPRSSTPIYTQIVDEVKESILKGILEPGDKMPSVRELAKMMTINPNTIQKAYKELERQMVIEKIRGKGTFVSTDYKGKRDESRMKLVKESFKKGLIELKYMGIKEEETMAIIKELIREIKGDE
ncbi:GntR family transcriptional regulator [Anaeromicrobium sediminis]|uniref:GntR family transcriptional regulator n=1 Tax=Anaeromicrobium sediminis TaxID=1478221 RepID=A0A267MGN9_9FIRM|nr:GntR family transcriptional regulator [Anaeromicrobium sediminis]PAB58078.1 GntR family transcriptional regulator [Anaeromicrobium sediminis]